MDSHSRCVVIDLNEPPQGEGFAHPNNEHELTFQGMESGAAPEGAAPGAAAPGAAAVAISADDTNNTAAPTGQTISSEDSGSEGEVQSTPEIIALRKPFIGMKFDSWEDAKIHYNKYAKHEGFSMKMSSSRNSVRDKQKDKYLFVCNKSGKSAETTDEVAPVKQRNRAITIRTDCQAKMRVKRIGERWEVTQFVEEHTHDLIQKFALKKYLRSHKKIPKEERHFIDILHTVNLSAGRVMDIMGELYGSAKAVPYDTKAISNYKATIDDNYRIKDVALLLDYFEELKKEDPNFYYKYKLDSEDRVVNIFWVDGGARSVYKEYHDCISFDTTYMTNMYKMPCAPFIGINRFGQSIQLGCGFVRNEKIPNFAWLFEQFLEAMDGLHPLNFITDQDSGMRSAILAIFPHTCHRNCRWHIMQDAQGTLGGFMSKRELLRREFNEIIDYSLTPAEFESRWDSMLETHGVRDNTHLADIYDIRAQFVPAYFMSRFFPFLQTTARSEGFNAVLKKYVSPHDSLFRFFKQYMKLQERIEIAEDANEFQGEDKTLRAWSDFPMEEKIKSVYTLPIYRRFQTELRKFTSYNVRQISDSVFECYPVREYVFGYGKRNYMVKVDLQQEQYDCECCKFSRDGLICCHIIKVMTAVGAVEQIPERYILPRWSVPPPDIIVPESEPQQMPVGKISRKEMRLLRYGNLIQDFTKIAATAASSDKSEQVARKHMKALEDELASNKKAATEALKKRKKQSTSTKAIEVDDDSDPNDIPGSSSVGSDPTVHDQRQINQKVRDPPCTTTKGRPEEKRKKSGLHLKSSRSVKCTICSSIEHTSKDCPAKIAMKESNPLMGLFR